MSGPNIIKATHSSRHRKNGLPDSHPDTRVHAYLMTMSVPREHHTEATRLKLNMLIRSKSGIHFSPQSCIHPGAGRVHFEIGTDDGYEHAHAVIVFSRPSPWTRLFNALRKFQIQQGYPQTSVHFNHTPKDGPGARQVVAAGGPAAYLMKYLTDPVKNKLVDKDAGSAPRPVLSMLDRISQGPRKGELRYKTVEDLRRHRELILWIERLRYRLMEIPHPSERKRRRNPNKPPTWLGPRFA